VTAASSMSSAIYLNMMKIEFYYGDDWGHAVAQLVEALSYIPECRGFDSRWCHWNFSLTLLLAALWPWV
jgi:hypothetical protein